MKNAERTLLAGRKGVEWLYDTVARCRLKIGSVVELPRRGKLRRHRIGTTLRILLALLAAGVLFAAALLAPTPSATRKGSIELFKAEDMGEVYGPEVPEHIVQGYVAPNVLSALITEDESQEDSTVYVYTRESKKDYHLPTCKYAYASGKHITPYEAYFLGYAPGKCCDPPVYTP